MNTHVDFEPEAKNIQIQMPKHLLTGIYDAKKQEFRKKYKKVSIKVFVTKTRKFRARIIDPGSCVPYEVTVGGKEWKKGKGQPYQARIMKKCENLLLELWTQVILVDN